MDLADISAFGLALATVVIILWIRRADTRLAKSGEWRAYSPIPFVPYRGADGTVLPHDTLMRRWKERRWEYREASHEEKFRHWAENRP